MRAELFQVKTWTMPLRNEKGFVLVMAMVTLLIVVAMGIFASNMSTTESMISGVQRVYKENFYQAESATFEAAQILQDASNTALSYNNIPGLVCKAKLEDPTIADPLEKVIPPTGRTDLNGDGEFSTQEITHGIDLNPADPPAANTLSVSPARWDANAAALVADPDLRYLVIDEGLTGNLDATKPMTHRYMAYGKSRNNTAEVTIRVEYRKKYMHE